MRRTTAGGHHVASRRSKRFAASKETQPGLVRGPLWELQFRRGIVASEGDLFVFMTRPLSAILLLPAVIARLEPHVTARWGAPLPPHGPAAG